MDYASREYDRRWVIPSLDVRLPQPSYAVQRETVRYWMVELTSKDGDVLNFYVKARTSADAMVKANDNRYRMSLPKQKRKLILID